MVNAAIGATTSMCGLSLVQQELIDTGCDVVFVEYACNDDEMDRQERMRTREGLVRKLLAAGIDVVIVYVLDILMVSADLILTLRNKVLDRLADRKAEKEAAA